MLDSGHGLLADMFSITGTTRCAGLSWQRTERRPRPTSRCMTAVNLVKSFMLMCSRLTVKWFVLYKWGLQAKLPVRWSPVWALSMRRASYGHLQSQFWLIKRRSRAPPATIYHELCKASFDSLSRRKPLFQLLWAYIDILPIDMAVTVEQYVVV